LALFGLKHQIPQICYKKFCQQKWITYTSVLQVIKPVQSMFSSKEIPIDSLKKLIQILGTWYLYDGHIVVKPSACHDYFKKLQQE
jgi:hypothetical protein